MYISVCGLFKSIVMKFYEELKALQPVIYQTAYDKGFWEQGFNRNKDEMIMLIVSELGEALEAHRKDRRYTKSRGEIWLPYLDYVATSGDNEAYILEFEKSVKDTVEDEIADAVIRILDYIGGWKFSFFQRDFRKESTGNFGADLLVLVNCCTKAREQEDTQYFTGMDWGYAMAAIVAFCEWYNINLLQHIEWKMKYNNTRPYKHGKGY